MIRPFLLSRRPEIVPMAVVGALCLAALGLWLVRASDAKERKLQAPTVVQTRAAVAVPKPAPPPKLTPQNLAQARPDGHGGLTVHTPAGEAPLTIDANLQAAITAELDRQHVPYAAVVLLEPRTGAIRAIVEHREPDDPVGLIGSLVAPLVPAASVFKVVTSAALLEAGQSPETRVCFHGGKHGIDASLLTPGPRDNQCQTLTEALAHSTNAAFARLALEHLKPGDLARMAQRLGFGQGFQSDLDVQPSHIDEGTTALERGRCAPGFAGSTLSPVHAAFLAATVANGGLAMRPTLLASQQAPTPLGQLLPPGVAMALGQMMQQTVVAGTGRHAFGQRPASLRGMAIAGKTGSLSGDDPAVYRHFSWFIGFAPADDPQIAVAALAINGLKWKTKGPVLARDALALYFAGNHHVADAASHARGVDAQAAHA